MEERKLNIFQRCIRIWEEAHPYNAAQILEILGEADVGRIAEAWNETLEASGLGMVRVKGKRFGYVKAPRQEVAVVEGSMEAYVTREMNRAFGVAGSTEEVMPFRAFVVPGEGRHHLGVIYQHWVADSISMRMLLREWFCRLHDPSGVTGKKLVLLEGGLWRFFGPGKTGWGLAAGVMGSFKSLRQFRTARRLTEVNKDHSVVCSVHRLEDGVIEGLVEAARARKATVNDLLMAGLARACDEHGPEPRRSERDLALGTIVDLRSMSGEDLENTFGLFLGYTELVVSAGDLRDREKLLAAIASTNAKLKERRAAAASMVRMAAGFMQGRYLSQERRASFYRNYMPLFGGVSNVNMNRSWPAKHHPARLVDYIRVAPTGPMVPVVIAATTLGRRFTFTLTRRGSVVDEASGGRLAQAFIDELTALHKMG